MPEDEDARRPVARNLTWYRPKDPPEARITADPKVSVRQDTRSSPVRSPSATFKAPARRVSSSVDLEGSVEEDKLRGLSMPARQIDASSVSRDVSTSEQRDKIKLNGLEAVPTGPKPSAPAAVPRAPRSMIMLSNDNLLSEVGPVVRSSPHIFIDSSWLPAQLPTRRHLFNYMKAKGCGPREIHLDETGWYLTFEDTPTGHEELDSAYRKCHAKQLFHQYSLQMQPFHDGQAPSKLGSDSRLGSRNQSPGLAPMAPVAAKEQPLNQTKEILSDPRLRGRTANSVATEELPQTDLVECQAKSHELGTTGAQPPLHSSPLRIPSRQDKDDAASSISGKTTSSDPSTKHNRCHVCQASSTLDVDPLVQCTTCPRRYHRRCHPLPPLPARLEDTDMWQCRRCVKYHVEPKKRQTGIVIDSALSSTELESLPDRPSHNRVKPTGVDDEAKATDNNQPPATSARTKAQTVSAEQVNGTQRAEAVTQAQANHKQASVLKTASQPKVALVDTSAGAEEQQLPTEPANSRQAAAALSSSDVHFDEAQNLVEESFNQEATKPSGPAVRPKLNLVRKKVDQVQSNACAEMSVNRIPSADPSSTINEQAAVLRSHSLEPSARSGTASKDVGLVSNANNVLEVPESPAQVRDPRLAAPEARLHEKTTVHGALTAVSPTDIAGQIMDGTAKRTKTSMVRCIRCQKKLVYQRRPGITPVCTSCRSRESEGRSEVTAQGGVKKPALPSEAAASSDPRSLDHASAKNVSDVVALASAERPTSREPPPSMSKASQPISDSMSSSQRTSCDDCRKSDIRCTHNSTSASNERSKSTTDSTTRVEGPLDTDLGVPLPKGALGFQPTANQTMTSRTACDDCRQRRVRCTHNAPLPSDEAPGNSATLLSDTGVISSHAATEFSKSRETLDAESDSLSPSNSRKHLSGPQRTACHDCRQRGVRCKHDSHVPSSGAPLSTLVRPQSPSSRLPDEMEKPLGEASNGNLSRTDTARLAGNKEKTPMDLQEQAKRQRDMNIVLKAAAQAQQRHRGTLEAALKDARMQSAGTSHQSPLRPKKSHNWAGGGADKDVIKQGYDASCFASATQSRSTALAKPQSRGSARGSAGSLNKPSRVAMKGQAARDKDEGSQAQAPLVDNREQADNVSDSGLSSPLSLAGPETTGHKGKIGGGGGTRVPRTKPGDGLGGSYVRPKGAYVRLIGMALCEADGNRLQSQSVVDWVVDNIPGYEYGVDMWENGIKAILSMHTGQKNRQLFTYTAWKEGESAKAGKGGWYGLQPGVAKELEQWDPVLKQPVSPPSWAKSDAARGGANGSTIPVIDSDVEDPKAAKTSPRIRRRKAAGSLKGHSKPRDNSDLRAEQLDRDTQGHANNRDDSDNGSSPRIPRRRPVKHASAVATITKHPDTNVRQEDAMDLEDAALVRGLFHSKPLARSQRDGYATSSDEEPLAHVQRHCARQLVPPPAPMHALTDNAPVNGNATYDAMDIDASPLDESAQQTLPSGNDLRKPRDVDPIASRLEDLLLEQAIRAEAENIDYSAKSLFEEWPEHDPVNEFDRAAKIQEIKKRPTRKKMFGKPALYSRLDSNDGVRSLTASKAPSPRTDQFTDRLKRSPRKTLAPAITFGNVETNVKHFDTLKAFFNVPDDLIPFAQDDGALVFRDNARDENGKLLRAKAIYRTGPN